MTTTVQIIGDASASISEKLSIFLALGLLLTVPFFAIQYHPLFPASVVPVTVMDQLIPFYAPAVIPYLSLYGLLVLPFLLVSITALRWRLCAGVKRGPAG